MTRLPPCAHLRSRRSLRRKVPDVHPKAAGGHSPVTPLSGSWPYRKPPPFSSPRTTRRSANRYRPSSAISEDVGAIVDYLPRLSASNLVGTRKWRGGGLENFIENAPTL